MKSKFIVYILKPNITSPKVSFVKSYRLNLASLEVVKKIKTKIITS